MRMLKRILNIFWKMHLSMIRRNIKLKGMHTGETCIIFGNGGSLKYYDLSVLPDLPIICTSYSLVDKRLTELNVRYWVVTDPYILYTFWFKSSSRKLLRNLRLPIFKKMALQNTEITVIASLTNCYSFIRKMKNIIYFHHFDIRSPLSFDLSENFNSCTGALDLMIGVARYLGFSKVILLGCDYLASPKLEGHFYGDSVPFIGIDDPGYASRISNIVGDLEVLTIFPKGYESHFFKSASYGEYFGCTEKYQSNSEFIDTEYLAMMRKAAKGSQIYM